MTDRTTSVFKIVQSYGGLKEAYIEVAAMTSAEALLLTSDNVVGVYFVDLYEEDDSTGRLPLSFAVDPLDPTNVSPTYANILTLKTTAKTGIKVSGTILFRDY